MRPVRQAEVTALLEKALRLYRGHILPGDTKQPWSISLRERQSARFHNSVSSLGRHWVETGQYDNAVRVFLKGLEIDDLAEEFYQHLMVCYHQIIVSASSSGAGGARGERRK